MRIWFQKSIQPKAIRLLSTGLGLFLQAWMRSVDARIADYGTNADAALREFNRPALYIMWHEYILLPATSRKGSDLTLLVGLHRDADWFSEVVENFGFKTVRGSSSRGGIKAILQYKREHQQTSLVLTPDGPRGPRRVLSPGCIQLASLLRIPVIPIGCGFNAPFRNGSWDHFAVPRFGSRGRMILGPAIDIPRKLNEDQLEAYRMHVETIMHTINAEAEGWAMDGLPRARERPLHAAPHASQERVSSLGVTS